MSNRLYLFLTFEISSSLFFVLKNIWDDEQLGQVADECEKFEDWDEEKKFFGSIGKRTCGTLSKFPPTVLGLVNYCNSAKFLRSLEVLTGEIGLIPDPYLYGGGIHSTLNNGFLKMHADFNWHHHLKLYRHLQYLDLHFSTAAQQFCLMFLYLAAQ